MSLDWLLKSFAEEDPKPKKADKGEISLTGILQRKRVKLSHEKSPREASINFSPYNVGYGFCMREKVAQIAGYTTIHSKLPTPKEQMVMDIGTKYHELLQRYFWKCGILEGWWRCNYCEEEWYGVSPKSCDKCKKRRHLEYREVPLSMEQYMLRGRADGIILVERNKREERHLMDIKSISNKGAQHSHQDPRVYFEDLDTQGPILPHVVQLSCYMLMSGIHDAHLLYVGKNAHQMKSFHIKYNETLLRPYLDDIIKAIEWSTQLRERERQDLPAPCSRAKCECQDIIIVHDTGDSSTLTNSIDTVHRDVA